MPAYKQQTAELLLVLYQPHHEHSVVRSVLAFTLSIAVAFSAAHEALFARVITRFERLALRAEAAFVVPTATSTAGWSGGASEVTQPACCC